MSYTCCLEAGPKLNQAIVSYILCSVSDKTLTGDWSARVGTSIEYNSNDKDFTLSTTPCELIGRK